jgi:polar amino acid transport system permease protein
VEALRRDPPRVNYHFNFGLIWRNFDRIAWGLLLSLELAAACIALGIVIGLLGALAHTDGPRWLRGVVTAYVEFIRNVPLILLVYLVFYGIPSAGGFSYGPVESFVMTLSLYAGAYLVEVFRSGLDAVPKGLLDAGKAIGLTPAQRFLHIRLPTMFRVVLPSLSNTFVSLFKDTSVASVIAVPELAYAAQWINFNTFRIVEVYAVVTPIYLVTGYTILFLLRLLERRYAIRA